MANISTITYNGKVIAETEEPGDVAVQYEGRTLATLSAGQTKTFQCTGDPMKRNLYIGSRTLLCEMTKMITDIVVAVKSAFPEAPTAYNLIGTYTASQTWTAPESGYFKIEVFGASGSGGTGSGGLMNASGGGGGGGGYSCSQGVTLNKNDSVVLTIGGVGSTTSAKVDSTHNNSFDHTLQVTSGANGGTAVTYSSPGGGGSGGVASGGKTTNTNGGNGGGGVTSSIGKEATPGGGGAGANGAPNGGAGGKGSTSNGTNTPGSSGSAGFIKIYRGNTN